MNAEMNGAVSVAVGPQKGDLPKLKLEWKAKSKFPGNIVSDADLRGTITGNPIEQMFFVTTATDPVSSRIQTCQVMIKITYTAVFHELKTVGPS